jgi:type II secretory pathway pseudopilin PulG
MNSKKTVFNGERRRRHAGWLIGACLLIGPIIGIGLYGLDCFLADSHPLEQLYRLREILLIGIVAGLLGALLVAITVVVGKRPVNSKKTGFTLREILLTVVMLSILGYCVMPRVSCAAKDAWQSNLQTNLQSIRAQLELYKKHHNGAHPTDITAQLTGKTDSDGTINASGEYGPYLQQFPANPCVANRVEAVKTTGKFGEGWDYDPATGAFIANTNGTPRKPPRPPCKDRISWSWFNVSWGWWHFQ